MGLPNGEEAGEGTWASDAEFRFLSLCFLCLVTWGK